MGVFHVTKKIYYTDKENQKETTITVYCVGLTVHA